MTNALATIDRIGVNTQFGTKKILDGSAGFTGSTSDTDITFLKADSATRKIPVIALTAHASAADKQQAFAAGADDYEAKPVDFDRLLGKITALLQRGAP